MLGICNLCGFVVARLQRSALGTRCLWCRSSAIHRAVGWMLQTLPPDPRWHVYELSSRGALNRYLRRRFPRFYDSEYFDDVPPGASKGRTVCQDVQHLLLQDETFDLVTATEVFEHVPDDRQGFREIFRVLKPGGCLLFTVPLAESAQTIERCRRRSDGTLEHRLPPEFHGDRIRGPGAVLAFRNYGRDVVDRLAECGFCGEIRPVTAGRHLVFRQPVIVAHKNGAGPSGRSAFG